MSRFHPVRPKKNKHKHRQVPQSAAPTQPTSAKASEGGPTPPELPSYAEAEKLMLQQLEKARTELYKLHNGDVLDESIARWKRMLQIYDREAEVVFNSDMSKPHRWTVSPAMALRAEKHLEVQLQRQSDLLDECHKQAHQIVSEHFERREAEARALCPPKQTPAPQAGSEATKEATSNPSNEEGPPIDPKPVA